jgi:hypothetical protein
MTQDQKSEIVGLVNDAIDHHPSLDIDKRIEKEVARTKADLTNEIKNRDMFWNDRLVLVGGGLALFVLLLGVKSWSEIPEAVNKSVAAEMNTEAIQSIRKDLVQSTQQAKDALTKLEAGNAGRTEYESLYVLVTNLSPERKLSLKNNVRPKFPDQMENSVAFREWMDAFGNPKDKSFKNLYLILVGDVGQAKGGEVPSWLPEQAGTGWKIYDKSPDSVWSDVDRSDNGDKRTLRQFGKKIRSVSIHPMFYPNLSAQHAFFPLEPTNPVIINGTLQRRVAYSETGEPPAIVLAAENSPIRSNGADYYYISRIDVAYEPKAAIEPNSKPPASEEPKSGRTVLLPWIATVLTGISALCYVFILFVFYRRYGRSGQSAQA